MGGGFGKSGKPDAPDFQNLAKVNQNNPFGSVSWGTGPNGETTMNTSVAPGMQNAFNNLTRGLEGASNYDPAAAGQQAFDKVYGSFQSRLDPMWQQNQNAFNAQMANSGAEPGSEAFGNASRAFGQQRNDAYNQAIGQSVGLGQAEQGQARQNAMLPFMQTGMMHNWLPQGDPMAPYMAGQAQYQGELDKYSADQAKKGSGLSGLGTIGGMAAGSLLAPKKTA